MAWFAFSGGTVWADEYGKLLRRDLRRGTVNLLTFPLEIPIAVQDYHEQSGLPFIRHTVGMAEGMGRSVMRLGSGLCDFAAAFLPGLQKGIPVQPETLF